jgi:predicted nucleotidyltransferase
MVGTKDLETRLRDQLRDAPPGVVCAYLYGSLARGEAGPESDIDVAVLFEKPPGSRLDAGPFDLEGELESALGRPVQVVVLNRAPADLVHRVLRDGRVALDRDRAARIRFEVAKRNEYFDLEPIRRLYRKTGSRPA